MTVITVIAIIIFLLIIYSIRRWISENIDLWGDKITNWIREHGLRGHKYRIYIIESPSPTEPQKPAETKPPTEDTEKPKGQDYE